jgi:hypothetical protein
MQEKNMSNKKEALFVLESQPLHLGELISVLLKIGEYDIMHICVSSTPKAMPIPKVVATWLFLLHAYKHKITVSSLFDKFTEIAGLPEIFKHCTVLTTSKEVYVHMTSLNIPVELVPRALGFYESFQRTAYRQGRALDYLLNVGAKAAKYTPQERQNE